MNVSPHTLIDGKFQVRGTIGSGGMGIVYEVVQTGLDRVVALKLLNCVNEHDSDIERFEREALILSRFSHPGIVQFYAYGVWQTHPYMVMERVQGESLHDRLNKTGALSIGEASKIGIACCDALDYAHSRDVFHRDVKPSNILIDERNPTSIKLIDFGLAKLLGPQMQKLTQTGIAVGSALYISPEQAMGKSADSRSDIYSLGCVLYHAIAGVPPFTADNAAALFFQHVNEPISNAQRWETIPNAVRNVLSKCMAKDPDQRYASAAQLKQELEVLLKEAPTLALQDSPTRRPTKPLARSIILSVVTAGVLITGAVIVANLQRKPEAFVDGPTARERLARIVMANNIGSVDEAMRAELEAILPQVEQDPYADQSYLLNGNACLISYYKKKRDWAKVRALSRQALHRYTKPRSSDAGIYLGLLYTYHYACVNSAPVILDTPILEKALKDWDATDVTYIALVKLALAECYVKLGRIAEAETLLDAAEPHLTDDPVTDAKNLRGIIAKVKEAQKKNGS